MTKKKENFNLSCPIPISDYPRVILPHGGGGKLMHQLIEKMFVAAFDNSILAQRHDSAVIDGESSQLAMTTDSYVVDPIIFPGGDIGSLAVYGTVNDLAMSGAVPKYLSLGLIIEEGLSMETLWRIVQSIKNAAQQTGVQIVTGDTKVVDKGKGDQLFINTTGVGFINHQRTINPSAVRQGDAILLSGDVGRHGMAIMAVREGLSFESKIESDSAPVADIVQKLLSESIEIHCLRDVTRGGLASVLNEVASTSQMGIHIHETKIPVQEEVHGACEILGFDPLYVACEGRFVAFIAAKDASRALEIMKTFPDANQAALIGDVSLKGQPRVVMTSQIGVERIVDMMSAQQLPRIC